MSAAGTQNLEDILASIRQSLSDESVDGIVQLSAAAAVAARAERADEVKRSDEHADSSVLSSEEILRQRLAGALGEELAVADDASEAPTVPTAVADIFPAPSLHAVGSDVAGASPSEPTLNKLWFVRPGAQDEAGSGDAGSTPLHLDPFANLGEGKVSTDNGAAALFALSARAIVGDEVPTKPAPQAASSAPEAASRHEVPRLDANQIAMIKKLKASSAAAVDSITSDETLVELEAAAAPEPQAADQPVAEELATASTAVSDPTLVARDVDSEPAAAAEAEDSSELPASLLMRPANATPLFVGAYDKSQQIVTAALPAAAPTAEAPAPSIADDDADARLRRLFPNAAKEAPPAVADGDVEEVLQPVAAKDETPTALAAQAETAAIEAAPVVPGLDAFRAMAAAAAAPSSAAAGGPAADRSLEDMIAAVLEPVLQRLLEKSLAPMVETMVRQELDKVLRARREA